MIIECGGYYYHKYKRHRTKNPPTLSASGTKWTDFVLHCIFVLLLTKKETLLSKNAIQISFFPLSLLFPARGWSVIYYISI
jgi:hypothetical protein